MFKLTVLEARNALDIAAAQQAVHGHTAPPSQKNVGWGLEEFDQTTIVQWDTNSYRLAHAVRLPRVEGTKGTATVIVVAPCVIEARPSVLEVATCSPLHLRPIAAGGGAC